MHRSVFLFCFFLGTFGLIHSQDNAQLRIWQDSAARARNDTTRINYLRQISKWYTSSEPDSAVLYAIKAITLSRKSGWLKGEAQNLLNLGVALSNASKYDSAILVDGQALDAAIQVGDQNRVALIYINRSSAYSESYDFEKALADLKQALKIAEATGNKERKARVAQSLTEFYLNQDDYSAALPWAVTALQIQKEIGDSVQQTVSLLNLGGIYVVRKMDSAAEKILLEAIRQSRQQNRPDIFIECAQSLSDLYLQQQKPDQAISYLNTALVYARHIRMRDREAILCLNLGKAYLQKKEYDHALQIFRDGERSVKNIPSFRKIYYQCVFGEAESLSEMKRFAEAYETSALATRIKDSFLLQTQTERVARLQTQFETERRESEISILKKDKALAALALQRQRSIRLAIIVFTLLLFGIIALAIARYRAVQRTRQLLQIEKLRQTISRDLHDDVGSGLSSIHINSKMALNHGDDVLLMRDKLNKIQQNSAVMLQGMSDIVWAINPANDAPEHLIIRMKEFSHEMFEPLDIAVHFKEDIPTDLPETGLEKRKDIFMIFKEVINNAAKHSRAKNVWIHVETSKHEMKFSIKDDGRGFDLQTVSTGNGLANMKSRVENIHGEFNIQSAAVMGTEIFFRVPLP